MLYLALFLKTKISINPILELQIDTSMAAERLLSANLVLEISLYMIRPSPQKLRVKSPSHKKIWALLGKLNVSRVILRL